MKLNFASVHSEYILGGKSDSHIAVMFGVCRTAVSKFRKYHGILSRVGSGEMGERKVFDKLLQVGFSVEDMNSKSGKTHPFDLLIDASIRAEVKTANKGEDGMWRITLTNKQEAGVVESDHCIKFKTGRTKKLLEKSCDILIICARTESTEKYFVVPSSEIPSTIQTIAIKEGGKWSVWENRWDLIEQFNCCEGGEKV